MKYPYSVKVDGKWYRPNVDIPEKAVEVKETTKKLTEAKKPKTNTATAKKTKEKKA